MTRNQKRRARSLTRLTLLGLLSAACFFAGTAFPLVQAALPDAPPPLSGAPGAEPAASPAKPDRDAWNLRLVNKDNPLPADYEAAMTQLKNGHQIDSRAYPDLQAMMDAAREAGLAPLICSSFRTREKQEALFDRKVQSYLSRGESRAEAESHAAEWVARPGTSEHELGLALDIVSTANQNLDDSQEDTPEQQWLMEHCAEYGFILRYPTDKSALTGVGYEPWHYRYVGREAAAEITAQGLCLEEYLAA